MKTFANAVLLAALALPVALFLTLISHFHLGIAPSAAIAIASGWLQNIIWAKASQPPATEKTPDGNFVSIATRFGWVCPTVLVLVTSATWHFAFSQNA